MLNGSAGLGTKSDPQRSLFASKEIPIVVGVSPTTYRERQCLNRGVEY